MKPKTKKLKKELMKRKKIILVLIGVIGIVLVGICGYNWYFSFEQRVNRILASNVTVDSGVIDTLKWNTNVRVIVILHEQESYTIDEVKDSVLSTLSPEDFILGSRLLGSNGFAGSVTISGLEQLVNNPKVKKIELDEIGGLT